MTNPPSSQQTSTPPAVSLERLGGNEAPKASQVFEQRLVAAYDPKTQRIDVHTYLQAETKPPSADQVTDMLLGLERGTTDVDRFLDGLPVISGAEAEQQAPSGEINLGDTEKAAVNSLLDHGSEAPVKKGSWQRVIDEYGQRGSDIQRLAKELETKNPGIELETVRRVLASVHGELRADAYLGISRLSREAYGNPENWPEVSARLRTPAGPLSDEKKALFKEGVDEIFRQFVQRQIGRFAQQKTFANKGLTQDGENPDIFTDKRGRTYDLGKREDAARMWKDHLNISGGSNVRQEWFDKDYYRVLGVSHNASPDEIRTAYRKLAQKYHPDMSRDEGTKERFQELNDANEVLGDADKRAVYDRMRSGGRPDEGRPSSYGQQGREGETPPDGTVSAFYKAKRYCGGLPDYIENLGTGLFKHEKTGRRIDPRTREGAKELLDAILKEKPFLRNHPALAEDLRRIYGQTASGPASASPPPTPTPPPVPERMVFGPEEPAAVSWQEINFKAKISTGLQQRIVSAYDPQTGEFDLNILLSDPSFKMAPDRNRLFALFGSIKSGALNPEQLINKLPRNNKEFFEQLLYTQDKRGRYVNAHLVDAVCRLTGISGLGEMDRAKLDLFHAKYGPDQGSLVKLVSDLKGARVEENVILNLASYLHSSLRVRLLREFSDLKNIVLVADSGIRFKKAEIILKKGKPLTGDEKQAMQWDRIALGMQDVRSQQQPGPPPGPAGRRPQREPVREAGEQAQAGGIFGETNQGKVRPNNEDSLWLFPDGRIFMVADGIGGHLGGEAASRIVRENFDEWRQDRRDIDALIAIIEESNRNIYHGAINDSALYGMGSTVVAGILTSEGLQIAHVGDSRAYLINASGIQRLTNDHSWVEEKLREGVLTPEQARNHPQKNVITRSLGANLSVEVERSKVYPVRRGDWVLLCSDGLNDPLTDPEIWQIVMRSRNPQEASGRLIQLANDRGGPDNITVVIKRI